MSQNLEPSGNRERELFLQALEKTTPQERAAFLEGAWRNDAALRAAVEALLANANDPLLDHVAEDARATLVVPVTEQPGDRIDRYKLLQKIGEGGMGVVYMAEQEEPVRRQVAFKIIKLGMDTRSVVARFEAERQALAMMDHPNIARVLDAGATETGRPYFVMELVRGVPITAYCDKNHLGTTERLGLFIQVCHAIQHAHQKGVIHRDIKPSNVMVTLHDGVPVPKVIDFGIAKATGQRLTEKTLFTNYATMIGTPAYMSPEQAEMSGLDIDTRTDVYALGVLLYELLTGTTPFPADELLSKGYGEMQRIIAEVEPVRPSTRLSTMQNEERTVVAKNRGTEESALGKGFKGDLDWIVMKCLEKDRTRRYDTANGVAMDLKRHLTNEPVFARPPSAAYRIQKFVRRNKAGVIAAALVTLLLVAGVIGTSLGLVRAQRARAHALQAAHTATSAELKARDARTVTEENLYYNRVALAHRELTAEPPNIRDAEQLLEACPPEMRDWEWHYLKRLRLTEPLVLRDPESQEVYSIAFSPDGRHLASASGDGRVRIWDLDKRQLIQVIAAHTNFAFCVAFHPTDPGRVASVGADRQVKYWDWRSKTLLHSWPSRFIFEYGVAYSVAFSPDGRRLAAAGEEGVANVWDTETFELMHVLRGHELTVLSVAFSPDGKRIATGSHHGIARVWDAATGQLLKEMGDLGAPVSCVAFSRDGRELAATSFDYSLRIFDVESGEREPRRHIRAHNSLALGMAYNADGHRLATAGLDRVVALWDAASGRQVLALRDPHTEVFCVRFSPDGQRLAASSSDGAIHVWDAARLTGAEDKSLLTLRYPGELWTMAFSSRTNWHAYAGDHFSQPKLKEAPVLICETGTDRLVRRLAGHSIVVFSVAFDPSGPFLATSGDEPSRSGNATLKVWDLTTGAEAFSIEPVEGSGVLFALAYSKDGQRLIGGGSERKVKVWNARTGRMIGVIGEHKREISMLALSPDGKHLASAGTDHVVKVWDATRLDERQENPVAFEAARGDVTMTVAFSADSTRLGVASNDHTALVRDVATGNVVVTLQSRAHRFLALAFSPDGRWIASGGADCTLQLWDAQTGQLRHTFRGHTGAVGCVAFVHLPEGMRLVSASRDGTVKYWDLITVDR